MVEEGKFERDVYRRRGPDIPDALGPRDLYLLLKVPVGVLPNQPPVAVANGLTLLQPFVESDYEDVPDAAATGEQVDHQHIKSAQISGTTGTSSESVVDAERRLMCACLA